MTEPAYEAMTESLTQRLMIPLTAPPQLLAGRYRLEELIGRGGVGDVYRALDLAQGRGVAIKFLRDPAADPRRFASEVHALASFDHPNLVRLLDTGEQDGLAFLVTDLVSGGTLARLIGAGPLSPDEVARIGAAIAVALEYVHRRGVVHRDVKPSNILVGQSGLVVRLADFGVSRLIDAAGITTTGIAVGTPAYLAPEQVDAHDVGPAADVYSLGLVLLESLTARRAFEGTPSEVAAQRLQRGPDTSGVTQPGWRLLIRAMTSVSPAERPPAAELADYLQRFRSSGPLGPPSAASAMPVLAPPTGAGAVGLTTEQIPVSVASFHTAIGPPVPVTPAYATGSTGPPRNPASPPKRRPGYVDWLIALLFVMLALGIVAGYVIHMRTTTTVPAGSTLAAGLTTVFRA